MQSAVWVFLSHRLDESSSNYRSVLLTHLPTNFSSTEDFPDDWIPTTAICGKSMSIGTSKFLKVSCSLLTVKTKFFMPEFSSIFSWSLNYKILRWNNFLLLSLSFVARVLSKSAIKESEWLNCVQSKFFSNPLSAKNKHRSDFRSALAMRVRETEEKWAKSIVGKNTMNVRSFWVIGMRGLQYLRD